VYYGSVLLPYRNLLAAQFVKKAERQNVSHTINVVHTFGSLCFAELLSGLFVSTLEGASVPVEENNVVVVVLFE
jgi:cytochrome bd-type quinol oxidase subunit 2